MSGKSLRRPGRLERLERIDLTGESASAAEHEPGGMTDGARDPRPGDRTTALPHASEAEVRRILDFLSGHWDYEPSVFLSCGTSTANVLESFAPDFYLPDLELFIE